MCYGNALLFKRLWQVEIVDAHVQLFLSQGAKSPALQLSDLQEGQYIFQLTVTDSSGQQDSDTVSVTVLAGKYCRILRCPL